MIGRFISLEKKAMVSSWLSSKILKLSCFMSVTMRLFLSRTVANRLTKVDFRLDGRRLALGLLGFRQGWYSQSESRGAGQAPAFPIS